MAVADEEQVPDDGTRGLDRSGTPSDQGDLLCHVGFKREGIERPLRNKRVVLFQDAGGDTEQVLPGDRFRDKPYGAPLFIGKPEPAMIAYVLQKKRCSKDETVLIGDRLYTDIAAGVHAGVATVCVLSGETTRADISAGDLRPTYVVDGVMTLCHALKE